MPKQSFYKRCPRCKKWSKQSWSENLGVHQYIHFRGTFFTAASAASKTQGLICRHSIDIAYFVNRRQHICLGEAERTREDSNLQNSLCFKPLGSERQQRLIQWAAGPGDAGAVSSTMCIIGKQFLGSSRWSPPPPQNKMVK